MSISLVLVPLAVALTVTLKETALDQMKKQRGSKDKLESLQTDFTNCELLSKTLQEHGLPVSIISDNCISVKIEKYELVYERPNSDEAFMVSARDWDGAEELMRHIDSLGKEYKSNVQTYTYDRLIQNLSGSDMTIESETVLEDNSILLTINIDK